MELIKTDFSSKRVFGLDAFRALAILIVVYVHGRNFTNVLLEKFPAIPLIDGVELFFVLSGFLIGSILLQTINQENGLNAKSILTFWKRRWFRTLPNYYLMLLVNVILVKYGIIDGNLEEFGIKFIFFAQNLYHFFVDFFWESWSLAVEEWFYIILPLVLFFLLKLLPRKQAILLTISMLLILPLIYRISISGEQVDSFWLDVKFRKIVITRLDAIMFGVLMAFIKIYYSRFWEKYAAYLFVLGVLLILIALYIPREANSFYAKTFYFSLISLGAALLIPKADLIKSINNVWGTTVVTFISKISYSMYLVNLLVVSVIIKHFVIETWFEHLLAYIAYWSITIVISALLYNYFEKPLMNLRDRI